ncbi:SLAM family member 5-like isoform X6 [Cuculus canorus]|uniref:SLAM family member 5-like isoform X6 n=1 Tax=Cuculus canorus TaxID=55661 RepID=UPI0023AA6902|nr:SLAM family member 5-like isoform X6 [Cuculus canorus]
MLTQLQAAITGYLLLILQVSFAMVEITEKRYAVEGSSILMHAPDIKNISFIQWEYLSPTSSALILQHYADSQSLTIYPAYQGRVTFYQKNGSILLQGLEETDSGTYKATVDLMQDKARTTLLKVIKPVPQPELQCTSNLAGSPIELVCLVPEGVEVFSISWKKDGRPLPAEKCYLLSENITVLWIRNGEKSDCGTYSCNISNMISWKEATLNLMVTGLTPPLHHAQRLVIVALMFTTVSAISFIIQLFHRFGFSAAFILLALFCLVGVIGSTEVAAAAVRPESPRYCKIEIWHKVSQNSTAPTTLIVNLLFTTLLLHNVQKLHERGCSEAVHLTASCGFAAVAIFIVLLLLLLWYHRNKPKEKMTNITRFTQSTQDTTSPVLEETRGQKQEEE